MIDVEIHSGRACARLIRNLNLPALTDSLKYETYMIA
jgi:hypothetical protein